jgi:hypothetical protein
MLKTKEIIKEFGTVKRFCRLNNINYKYFLISKGWNFQNEKGQKYLTILLNNEYINLDYYEQCKNLINIETI